MYKTIQFEQAVASMAALSPLGMGIGLHIRFVAPLISLNTWSKDWQDHYTKNVYGLRDPMVAWAFAKQGACRWSDCPLPDPFNIIKQAGEFGLKYGATISHGPLSSRSIAGVARGDREFTTEELHEIEEEFKILHVAAEPPEKLTKAQKEALELVASGLRYADAANRLNISESALKLRLSSARSRLLAKTTAEAIQRAKDFKLL